MATVTVVVSGQTGTGKSRILAEIEVALKAAGVPCEFATIGDEDAARSEHWALARSNGPVVTEWPKVVLYEVNMPLPPRPANSSGWSPIETAPRDGTPLMLFGRVEGATTPVSYIGWYLFDALDWIAMAFHPNRSLRTYPTHWMPLPPPPSREG